MELELNSDSYLEKRRHLTPERKVAQAKRQKTTNQENVSIDFNKAYLLQDAWVTQNPKLLSPASKLNYISLIRSYPHRIQNPQFILAATNREVLTSPVARRQLDRRQMKILQKKGTVIPLPANAFSEYVALPPETLEAKQRRQEQFHTYFLSINKVDYSTYQNLALREAACWIPFWNYIAKAKKEVLEGLREKIRLRNSKTLR